MLLEIQFLWVRLASANTKSHSRDAMLKNVHKILIIDLLVKRDIYVKSVTKINSKSIIFNCELSFDFCIMKFISPSMQVQLNLFSFVRSWLRFQTTSAGKSNNNLPYHFKDLHLQRKLTSAKTIKITSKAQSYEGRITLSNG